MALDTVAPAYDCSSSVEHLLYGGGLLPVGYDAASGELESFGLPGPGRWVTIYASADHVFMYVAGLRWDTHNAAGAGDGGTGIGWHPLVRSAERLRGPPPGGVVTRRRTAAPLLLAALALVMCGCGFGSLDRASSSSTGSPAATSPATPASELARAQATHEYPLRRRPPRRRPAARPPPSRPCGPTPART